MYNTVNRIPTKLDWVISADLSESGSSLWVYPWCPSPHQWSSVSEVRRKPHLECVPSSWLQPCWSLKKAQQLSLRATTMNIVEEAGRPPITDVNMTQKF
jgi:hypothetical protein